MTLLPPSLYEHTLWEEDKNPIWLGSSLKLTRNLARYKFPSKLSEAEMKSCTTLILEKINPLLKSPLYFPAEKLSPLDKEFIYEHFLCLESFQNADAGQGFLIDETGRFLTLLNLKNHLQLQFLDTTSDLLTAWAQLSKMEKQIGLDFAFSPRFGYLTSDPTCCGTALQVSLFLHLPALYHTGKLHEVLGNEHEIITMGLEGSLDDLIGDFLILKNRYTLGVAEEAILHTLQTTAMKLVAAEKTLRSRLKETGDPAIKDLTSRAFGLLMHSYQLQTKEALNSLSALKLGVDLGWISGISNSAINTLFFKCRHAHLAHLDPQTLPHKRAEFIHKALQGITLNER